MLSIKPLAYRVCKRLGWARSLAAAASERHELHPEERGGRHPAFFLPGQIDKIRSAHPEGTIAGELARLDSEAVHAATVAYCIRNVHYVDGVLYGGGTRHAQKYEPEALWPKRLPIRLDECALPSTGTGSLYFGHFITDDAATALLARQFGPIRFAPTTVLSGPHARRYLDLFQLPSETLRYAYIERAWAFQDFGMNQLKCARFERMRAHVRALPGKRSGHRVFLRRRGLGPPRGLANEEEVEVHLAREGFDVIDVGTESVEDIVRRTRDARIVCGVEGSAMMHGLLAMAPEASLVCIQPPHRFTNVLKDHADAFGMRYGFVVGEGPADEWRVSSDDVLKTIDLA